MLVDSQEHILCHVPCDFITAAENGNEVINDPSRARRREGTISIPRAYPPPMTQDLPLLWTAPSGVAPGFSHLFLSICLSYPSPSPFMHPLLDWREDVLVGKHNVEFSSLLALPYEQWQRLCSNS